MPDMIPIADMTYELINKGLAEWMSPLEAEDWPTTVWNIFILLFIVHYFYSLLINKLINRF